MKKSAINTRSFLSAILLGLAVSQAPAALAEGDRESAQHESEKNLAAEAEREELRRQREAMMASIEKSRMELERVAEEARLKAELLRAEAERVRAGADALARESEQAREEARAQLSREREELSRTHRQLRRASQEVVRAHRALALAEDRRVRAQTINLGDRAMMGVILGEQTAEGIKIIGVSPDGPAERAGIETGDILTSLRGESLKSSGDGSARDTIYRIMSETGDGEEISVSVLREGEQREFMIKPEKREPASWASYIRLPEPVVAPSAPAAPVEPGSPHVLIERIAVPPVDTAALAAEALVLADELESFHIMVEGEDGDSAEYAYEFRLDPSDFEFDTEAFSEIGSLALDEARVWFGAGASLGIQFAELNEGLAGYFDTDRGALVLDAPADNAFGLMAGDVVLRVGGNDINGTSDFIRALRDHEAGDEVVVEIKRNKRNVSLDVVIPENRFGFFHQNLTTDNFQATISSAVAED